MDQDKILKSKVAVANAIMKNPKLSRIFNEALKAPVGSTKRAQAKSVLSIINKTNPNKVYTGAGKGGPAGPLAPLSSSNIKPPAQRQTTTKDPRIGTNMMGKFFGAAWDEAKNIGSDIMNKPLFNSATIFPQAPSIKKTIASSTPSSISDTISKALTPFKLPQHSGTVDMETAKGYFTPKVDPTIRQGPTSIFINGKPVTTEESKKYGKTIPNISNSSSNITMQKAQELINTAKGTTGNASGTPLVTKPTTKDTTKKVEQTLPEAPIGSQEQDVNSSNGFSYTKKQESTTSGTSGGTNKGSGSTTGFGSSFEKGTTGTQEMNFNMLKLKAQDYIDAGYGPEVYSNDMLKTMEGKILPEALADLKKTIYDDYNVTNLLNEKNRLSKTSGTAKEDMIDYVNGRDQLIGNINSLLEKTNEQERNLDMSDPINAATVNNYRNYLLTLKGRQNKSYVGYINKSIDQLSTDLNNIETSYQNAVKMADEMYNNQGSIMEYDYKNKKSMLEDLYRNLEDAPSKANSRMLQQISLNKTLADISAGPKADPWLDETVKSEVKNIFLDSDGRLLPNLNVAEAISLISEQGNDFQPQSGLYLVKQGTEKAIEDETDISKIKDYLKNYQNQMETVLSVFNKPEEIKLTSSYIKPFGNNVIDAATRGIKKYSTDNAGEIKAAVKYLDKYPGISKEEFVRKFNHIDSEILLSYYNYKDNKLPNVEYSSLIDALNTHKKLGTPTSEEDLIGENISSIYSNYKKNEWESNF